MNLIGIIPPILERKPWLDQAAAFVFPMIEAYIPEDLDRALAHLNHGDWHNNLLTPNRMLRVELLHATDPNRSFRKTFREVWQTWRLSGQVCGVIPSGSALVQARARVPLWAFERLFNHSVTCLTSFSPHPLCPEHRLLSIDGLPLVLPRTSSLLAHFGTTRSQHGEAYYPQATAVWVTQLPCRGVIAERLAPVSESDQTIAPSLLAAILKPGDLMLGDGHYGTFPVQHVIQAAHAFYLVRASGTLAIEKHLHLRYSENECELHLRPSPPTRCAYPNLHFPDYLPVRALRLSIPARDDLNRIDVATFLTNLPRSQFPYERIAQISPLRWNQETLHNDVKTRSGLGDIRSQTPEGARREILSHLCCSNILRLLMQAAGSSQLPPSFTVALQGLRQANHQLRGQPCEEARIGAILLDLIRQQPVDLRPGRTEPRMTRPRKRPFPIFKNPRLEWRRRRKVG